MTARALEDTLAEALEELRRITERLEQSLDEALAAKEEPRCDRSA